MSAKDGIFLEAVIMLLVLGYANRYSVMCYLIMLSSQSWCSDLTTRATYCGVGVPLLRSGPLFAVSLYRNIGNIGNIGSICKSVARVYKTLPYVVKSLECCCVMNFYLWQEGREGNSWNIPPEISKGTLY